MTIYSPSLYLDSSPSLPFFGEDGRGQLRAEKGYIEAWRVKIWVEGGQIEAGRGQITVQ